MNSRGLLFIGHDAGRTGAPFALLHLLRWLKGNVNRPLSLLLPSGGELVPEFEKVADTWLTDRSRWCPGGRRAQLATAVGLGPWARRAEKADVCAVASRCSPGLIYANSIASVGLLDRIALEAPVLIHVHELGSYFRTQPQPALSRALARARRFIACSNAVKEHLAREHGIAECRIETVHESIPVDQLRATRSRRDVLRELEMPGDSVVVMGSGTASPWRKGTDLFVQLARLVSHQRARPFFVWVGELPGEDVARFEYDARVSGIGGRVRFIGGVSRPSDYIGAADIFALTSREDPYPLFCLEAAALGKPIVCFANAGGMPEFVEDDCGFVVPYLDLPAMQNRIIRLLDSADCRHRMGEAARQKVAERHDISVAAPRIMEIIERTIAGG